MILRDKPIKTIPEQAPLPAPQLGDADWTAIERVLPDQWQAKARELHAIRRTRGLSDPATLLRVLLIHIAQGCGLRETSERARLGGIATLSDVAILKRLRNCARWFEWMGSQIRQQWSPAALQTGQELRPCWSKYSIRLVDGTVVSEPGATGSRWRLHYSVQWPSLRADEVIVSTYKEGETLRRFAVLPNQVLVADRGFANPPGVAHVHDAAGFVVVRTNLVTLPLYTAQAKSLDVLACVSALQEGECGAWPAYVKHNKRLIAGRLCAVKKDAASSLKARARATRESQRNGTELQPRTLLAADYVLIFTTVAHEIGANEVLDLYRARWQIELVFKQLKSLAGLGHLKKHDPDAARAWLQGKLLVALLIDALRVASEAFSPWGYVQLIGSSTPAHGSDGQMEKEKKSTSAPSVCVAGVRADA